MGMSTQGSATNQINVTPLIDVLLVLLIIFLVATPVLMKVETIDVPRKADDTTYPEQPAVTVTVHADLTLSVEDGPAIPTSDLPFALRPHLSIAHNVFVAFDDGVPWREAIAVVDTVRAMDDSVHVALKTRE